MSHDTQHGKTPQRIEPVSGFAFWRFADAVLAFADATRPELRVAMRLLKLADAKTGTCWEANRSMAEALGYSTTSHVRAALATWERRGVIERVRRTGHDGKDVAHGFRLVAGVPDDRGTPPAPVQSPNRSESGHPYTNSTQNVTPRTVRTDGDEVEQVNKNQLRIEEETAEPQEPSTPPASPSLKVVGRDLGRRGDASRIRFGDDGGVGTDERFWRAVRWADEHARDLSDAADARARDLRAAGGSAVGDPYIDAHREAANRLYTAAQSGMKTFYRTPIAAIANLRHALPDDAPPELDDTLDDVLADLQAAGIAR